MMTLPPDPMTGELRPIPDPTRLTTEALMHEIGRVEKEYGDAVAKLKELHQLDVSRLQETIEAKLAAAIAKTACVEDIVDEKLNAVRLQFELVERQRVEVKQDNKVALDAALAAMKDSLTSLGSTYNSAHGALVSLVDDIKSRVTALEAIRMGGKESQTGVYAAIGVILTIIWIAIAVLSYMHK